MGDDVKMKEQNSWLWDMLISFDQMINVAFRWPLNKINNGPAKFGYPDETLSSVMGKNIRAGRCKFCYVICRIIHIIDKSHCQKTIEYDEGN